MVVNSTSVRTYLSGKFPRLSNLVDEFVEGVEDAVDDGWANPGYSTMSMVEVDFRTFLANLDDTVEQTPRQYR